MMAATTIAVTVVGTMATIAIANDRAPSDHLQDLLDHGFVVIAEGKIDRRI